MAEKPARPPLMVTAAKCMDYGMMMYGRKADQATAGYDALGGLSGNQACANCMFFMSPNSCTVVDDWPLPISPTGKSRYWTAIPQMGGMDPIQVVIVGNETAGAAELAAGSAMIKAEDGGFTLYSKDGSKKLGHFDTKAAAEAREKEILALEHMDGGGMMGMKAMMKKEGDAGNFPASDYAVMPDPESPSTWKMRMADTPGHLDAGHIADAITAMQPGGFRGQQADLSPDDKKQAISRLGAAIGKLPAAEEEQKANLRERLAAVKEVTGRGLLATVAAAVKAWWDGGQPATASPPPPAAGAGFGPFPGAGSVAAGFRLFQVGEKETATWRWVAWASNRYRDRDGDLFPEAAHKEQVAYLDAGGAMPELWLWHTPGTAWGQADWADYSDGFMLYSGTVRPGFEALAAAVAADPGLGVSHGYLYRPAEKAGGVMPWYRTFEISPLPAERAANPWCGLDMLLAENKEAAVDPTKRAFLVGKLGEARVAEIEAGTGALNKALADLGVDWKALLDTPATAAPSAEDLAAAAVKAVTDSPQLAALATGVKATADAVAALETRVKALERTDDEKIADAWAAKSRQGAATAAGYQASAAGDNVVQPGDKTLAGGPDLGWFGDIVNNLAGGAAGR